MERREPKVEECKFLAKPSIKADKLSYIKGSKPIYVNLFKISIDKNWTIYKYPVSFQPEIAKDNPRMKRALFSIVEPAVKKIYGECFLSGEMLYSFTQVKDKQQIPFKAREHDYIFIIDPHTNCFSINDENPLKNPAIKQIYELIFKEILRANPNLEFYRNLFVKSNEQKSIASNKNKIDFYPGFSSSIIYTPYGPYLNVSIKNKILSTSTCYEIMLSKKKSKGKYTRDEEDEIREYFIGRSVKTTYNRKNYIIDDVSFDKTPKTTTVNKDGNNLVLTNYYKVAHGITIKNTDQPLFVVNRIGSNNEKVTLYIVPELSKLAGIDDSVTKDGQFMKALAAYTKLTPKERVAKTNEFMYLLNENTQRVITDKKTNKVINKELSALEKKKIFQLNLQPSEKNNFSANYIETPTLTAGKNKQISPEERKPVPVSQSKDLVNWLCVYHKENYNDANFIYDSLQKASASYGIKVGEPEWVEMNSLKADDWKTEVEDYIKKTKYDMVVFILDKYLDNLYKEIKKHSLTNAGYRSQVIKTESLQKNAMSVASKIILQINYKLGGCTYKVNFNKDITSQNLMIVGIDSSHIAGKRTGVAMVATMNNEFTDYYNKIDIIAESKKESLVYCVSSFLKEAIAKFYETNKKTISKNLLPGGIVIYRQGVSREQKLFLKDEVNAISDFLNGVDEEGFLKSNPIPFFYILVNTKTSFKFFESTKQKNVLDYLNPAAGLLVMDDVTDPNFFEFYLQPQVVTQGTATPTCFHVAFGNMKYPEIIPKLTYDLCFLYANWQGPVRVPGPLKAAEKLSKMTAKYTKGELNEKLKNSQAYL
jgi:aubergine